MTTTTTTTRSIFLTAMAVAVLFSLVVSAGASAADPSQADQSKSKTMKKTESGLQYVDEKEGDGETPKTGQTCIVHYTGWLWENNAKGKEFDSSKKRNAPFAFHCGRGSGDQGLGRGRLHHEGRRQARAVDSRRAGLWCPRRAAA